MQSVSFSEKRHAQRLYCPLVGWSKRHRLAHLFPAGEHRCVDIFGSMEPRQRRAHTSAFFRRVVVSGICFSAFSLRTCALFTCHADTCCCKRGYATHTTTSTLNTCNWICSTFVLGPCSLFRCPCLHDS